MKKVKKTGCSNLKSEEVRCLLQNSDFSNNQKVQTKKRKRSLMFIYEVKKRHLENFNSGSSNLIKWRV